MSSQILVELQETMGDDSSVARSALPAVKKVKLKSNKEINELIRQGLVELLGSSDSGEIVHYGVKDGGQTHVISCWYDDYGTEYLVVDHEQPMGRTSYNNRKIMFEE